jgi:hypothetical protein
MNNGPPRDDDPTLEEEGPVFDGSRTDQLDDTYRFRIVIASESDKGTVGFDDRGQAQWRWITELDDVPANLTGTFDQLKALDNPQLRLKDEEEPKPTPPAAEGYNPYATGATELKKRR